VDSGPRLIFFGHKNLRLPYIGATALLVGQLVNDAQLVR
jgi:hypothetical protein